MFIAEAFATGQANDTSGLGASFANLVPIILLCLVVYFFLIRPQQKRIKEHKRVVDSIKRGDTVVTSGGIIGEVSKVDAANAQFVIEVAPKIEIKVLKSAISEVLTQKTATKVTEKSKTEGSDKKNKDKSTNSEPKKNDESKDKNKGA